MNTKQREKVQKAQQALEQVQHELQTELASTKSVATAIELGGITAAAKALETVC